MAKPVVTVNTASVLKIQKDVLHCTAWLMMVDISDTYTVWNLKKDGADIGQGIALVESTQTPTRLAGNRLMMH